MIRESPVFESTALMRMCTVSITSFERRESLIKCIKSIRNITAVPIIVVDDSIEFDASEVESLFGSVKVYKVPPDSGVSFKRNFGPAKCGTKYCLLNDDDLVWEEADFNALLKEVDGVDFVAARSPNNGESSVVSYSPPVLKRGYAYRQAEDGRNLFHFTTSYLFGRTETFLKFPWPDELKVGEHFAYAFMLHTYGAKIALTDSLKYKNLQSRPSIIYNKKRARANTLRSKWFKENTGHESHIFE
jgi:glycosyltransferase involved in cell wall biosynthesis